MEAGAVVEVAQVRELVAERVDQAGVAQEPSGRDVAQPDPDAPVLVADAVAPPDPGRLGIDPPQREPKAAGEVTPIRSQPLEQDPLLPALALRRSRMG